MTRGGGPAVGFGIPLHSRSGPIITQAAGQWNKTVHGPRPGLGPGTMNGSKSRVRRMGEVCQWAITNLTQYASNPSPAAAPHSDYHAVHHNPPSTAATTTSTRMNNTTHNTHGAEPPCCVTVESADPCGSWDFTFSCCLAPRFSASSRSRI